MKPEFSSFSGALRRVGVAAAVAAALSATLYASATTLADQPIFSTSDVPGNLALALSVEWPTASRTAHTDNYSSAATFLGYFDPNKCYLYRYDATANSTATGDTSYFYPAAMATNRTCTGTNDDKWSGNFLNWAGTATIDPFRWAMTGGRRVVDEAGNTILEKGWHSGQGLFNDRSISAADSVGATPLTDANKAKMLLRVNGMGFRMRFTIAPTQVMKGEYFNNTSVSGNAVVTDNNATADYAWSGSPATGVNADGFSTRFSGTFKVPVSGNYVFRTVSDDGVRLWIDTSGTNNFSNNNRYINNWTDHGSTTDTTTQTISMNAGQSFSVRLQHYDSTSGAEIRLLWATPSLPGVFRKFTNPIDGSPNDASGATPYQNAIAANGVYDLTMRVKVCDASVGVEANCKAYGSNYKPEGLIQKYSQKMRFSAFGYLNDGSDQRDGGVMRAGQKFVGPNQPVPGLPNVDNTQKEWSDTTGIFFQNPNSADATATTTATRVPINDSGVINYLNKFGQLIPGNYKSYDPVSEMYYAVLRYYKNLGNISSWSDMGGADANTKKVYLDGFPVVTNWVDPIQYSCQRNFVLGIGDIYTHVDKNVPGNTDYRTREPAAPDFTTDTVNAVTATNKVGNLQGLGNIGNTNSYSGRDNSAYIAGLAYDANTTDIRPEVADQRQTIGKQTVQTYWVDVLEQAFQANNQFYLAAKYGGLKVPTDFKPYADDVGTIPKAWWSTNGETLTDTRTNPATVQDKPDNYFTAGRPDTMVSGLTKAFESIANAIKAYTTSFSLSTVQVSSLGAASYASQYDAGAWTGVLSASQITFAADGTPSSTVKWQSSTTLETQLAGTGWDTGRNVVTWNGTAAVPFRSGTGGIGATLLSSLRTTYVASGDDSANYLKYLRGDRSNEKTSTDATKPYRQRALLLGDIVGAKVTPVGPPSMNYSDAVNLGYAAFKTAKASRPTMVYVGSNDGMLHAFNGGLTGTGVGTERFAYIPGALFQGPNGTPAVDGLAQLGNPNYLHRYYVDATPKVFDIDFNYSGGTFTTTSSANSDWHSVLIGGLGKGGKSFYAIDVTDPLSMTSESTVAGKVLWEFTDATMGYSFGEPMVIKTKKHGWVVVLTSGYNNSDGIGYLYILNPRTGALLQKIATGSASNGLTQASAFIRDFSDGTADAIYAGDLDGQLWRFDVSMARTATGSYPAPVKLATLASASATSGGTGTPQAITTQPLIEIQPLTKKRYVMVGTGRLLDSTDINTSQAQTFYAILDGNANAFNPVSTPITRADLTELTSLTDGVALSTTSMGWYMELGSESNVPLRLVSSPTAYSGIVAFSTLSTSGDACSPSGKSRVYAIDFGSGQSALEPAGTAYVSYDTAVTDLKFVGVDGRARLITGDVVGNLRNVGFRPPKSMSLRLLNWREIPTVD